MFSSAILLLPKITGFRKLHFLQPVMAGFRNLSQHVEELKLFSADVKTTLKFCSELQPHFGENCLCSLSLGHSMTEQEAEASASSGNGELLLQLPKCWHWRSIYMNMTTFVSVGTLYRSDIVKSQHVAVKLSAISIAKKKQTFLCGKSSTLRLHRAVVTVSLFTQLM